MSDQQHFNVIWPSNEVNSLTSAQLKGLAPDIESWANFLFMLTKRRRFAAMNIYDPSRKESSVVKVLSGTLDPMPRYEALV